MVIKRRCIFLTTLLILPLVTYTILVPLKDTVFAGRSEDGMNAVPIEVTARADKREATIGDKIKFTVCVKHKDDTFVQFPELNQNIGVFTVKKPGEDIKRVENGYAITERSYELCSYEIGNQAIPPMEIKYKGNQGEGAISTDEVTITIKGVITEGDNPTDIKDIVPPVEIPTNFRRLMVWVFAGLGGFFVSGVLYWLITRFKKAQNKQEHIITIRRTPHEIAYELLERLLKEDLVSKGMIREYYYRLTNIVRHYIENRFGLLAPERTTEEFLAEMAHTDKLENKHKLLIQEFLEHCDMVKYAKYGPSKIEVQETYDIAKQLIDETAGCLEEKEVVVR